jgi:hypothetical protein
MNVYSGNRSAIPVIPKFNIEGIHVLGEIYAP